jgi:hypothetical protein
MNTVPQTLYAPEYESDAAEEIAVALVRLGTDARAEYMGFGTPVIVRVGDQTQYLFQGWGDEDGWYAGREWLDRPANMWQPDESEGAGFELPDLAGVTDLEQIARAIHAAVNARHPAA